MNKFIEDITNEFYFILKKYNDKYYSSSNISNMNIIIYKFNIISDEDNPSMFSITYQPDINKFKVFLNDKNNGNVLIYQGNNYIELYKNIENKIYSIASKQIINFYKEEQIYLLEYVNKLQTYTIQLLQELPTESYYTSENKEEITQEELLDYINYATQYFKAKERYSTGRKSYI